METEKTKDIYLIDGNSLCYRAYYAIQELTTSKGVPTNAIYGFINMLRKLMREYEPDMMTIAFDTPKPTARHEKYEDYKVHRKPTPDDLIEQMPRIKEVITAYNIPICEMDGYEADDVIATLAEKAKKKGIDVMIVTSDKDALQLVDDKVKVLSPHPMGDKLYDAAAVEKKYGVAPGAMVELMALMGDASDNIPGVKGIGLVTASKLVGEHGDLKTIYKNIEDVQSKSVKKKLEEGEEMAELSRELVELDREVPVKLDFKEAKLGEPDVEELSKLFREFEFEKLLRELAPKETKKGNYKVVSGEKDVEKICARIKKAKQVAIAVIADPGGKRVDGIAFSCKEEEAFYLDLSGKAKDPVKNILEDEAIEKIGYDLKDDILKLRSGGIDLKGADFDVMIADYLVDPARAKYDLAGIAMRHLDYNFTHSEDKTEWDDKGQGTMDLSKSVNTGYVCESSDIILRLHAVLGPMLKERHLEKLFKDVEMPLVGILADMEAEGVGIDIKCMKKLSDEMEKRLDKVTDKIYKLAGEEFNINSPKQLQVILFDKLGLPATKKTKTGASTDESVLTKLAKVHELPRVLLEYRTMNKLKTGYYDSILTLVDKKTSKLYARFNQAVTATGRLSSSEPNLQNIPIKTAMGKEIRRAFTAAGKGNVLIAADYSQVELRILAHLSQDKKLIKAFKNEEDVHKYTASLIFDCGMDEVTDQMRSTAKTVNFGIVYGMSPFGLAKDLGIDVGEAARFIDSYFKRYSGVKKFIEKTISDARKKGYVTTLLKRRRYIPEMKSSNERVKGFAERVAVNTPVQGSAADLIKLAMIGCHDEFKETDVKMVIQVHDELVFEVPKEKAKEVSKKIKEIMEGIIELEVPLEVDVEAGVNWLDMETV